MFTSLPPAVQQSLEAIEFMNSFASDKNKLVKERNHVYGHGTELVTKVLETALESYRDVKLTMQTTGGVRHWRAEREILHLKVHEMGGVSFVMLRFSAPVITVRKDGNNTGLEFDREFVMWTLRMFRSETAPSGWALMEEDCEKILPGETEPVRTAEALREWARGLEF